MKRFIPLVFIFFILSAQAFPQDAIPRVPSHKNPQAFWRRVSLGGYFSLQFGSVTAVAVSPEASVRIVNQLYGGLGFSYQFVSFKDYFWDNKNQNFLKYESSMYGGRIFFRYYLRSFFDNFLGNFFAHTEYEYLYYTLPYTQTVPGDPAGTITDPNGLQYKPGREGIDVNSLFVGGGFSQPIAGRAYLDILLLFNLNESYNSPYANPIFRIGFGVGL